MQRNKYFLLIRSTLFWIVYATSTFVYGAISPLLFLLPLERRYPVIMSWTRVNVWALKMLCGIDYRIEGLENLPDRPAIIMAKHSSTWETMALPGLLPRMSWVLKKELMYIPFFGWGLAVLDHIAIDRKAGRNAVRQVVEQGKQRLESGRWVVIFPEGTRVKPGQRGRYKLGGGVLAEAAGVPVVPIAHNAGYFWPREQFIKYPGVITVRIGPPIDVTGMSAAEIVAAAESWIETEMEELNRDAEVQLK
ncbi:MAG TPA: 1-acyl-sn-glycerol-3-phosphate acyltransferase [Gammaproteobacteria bacterium]|nr:1-acyl-sn-glycerol-3-phosphate acyltransferase [Gammaproteobacteria bacterium]